MDALLLKYPEPCVSPSSALHCCDVLPLLRMFQLGSYLGFKGVLALRPVMLLTGMVYYFAVVLTVNACGILLLPWPVNFELWLLVA